MAGGTPWTSDEVRTLSILSGRPLAYIAERLPGRSVESCRMKRIELRLGRPKNRGDRGESNPSTRRYGPNFYRPKPPPSDDVKHLQLIALGHRAGFPFFPRVPI